MEKKRLLSISASVLAAAWIASDAGVTLAQSKGDEKSRGGTQSERTGGDSATPLPEKSRMGGGTAEKGTGSAQGSGKSQSGMDEKSRGGTQSERVPDSDTPLPSKSPMRGAEKGAGSTQSGMKDSKTAQPGTSSPDTSKGGTQSQRTGEAGTPLPEGSRYGGAKDPSAGSGRSAGAQRGERWAMQDIKEAQEALKDKGHDPGPIDGVMGPKTREAIRAFQSSSGVQATGSLNAETAQKLGVERDAGSGSSSRGSMDKDRSGGSAMPKDSTQRDPAAPVSK